jgi:hypothetical protein
VNGDDQFGLTAQSSQTGMVRFKLMSRSARQNV